MKRKTILRSLLALTLLYALPAEVRAQHSFEKPGVHYRAGAYGALIYPGLQGGIELPSKVVTIYTHRKKKVKSLQKEWYWGLQAGMFHQRWVQQQYYVMGTRSLRRVYPKQRYSEVIVGLGLSRSFVGAPVYGVSDQGEAQRLRAQGHMHGVFSSSCYLGRDKATQVKPYIGLGQISFLGNNRMPVIRPTLEFGVRLPATHLQAREIKSKVRHRGRKKYR